MSQSLVFNYILHPYSLVLFTIIFFCVYKYKIKHKFEICKQTNINNDTFIFLHNYRVNNIYFCFTRVFIYFLCNISTIFFIRVIRLNTTLSLTSVNPHNLLNISSISYLILISLCLFYYFKMLKELFFIDIIRLFFYYYKSSRKFYNLIDFFFTWRFVVQNCLYKISSICHDLTNPEFHVNLNDITPKSNIKTIYNKIKSYNKITKIIRYFNDIILGFLFDKLIYINIIIHQIPFICLIMTLLYDISNKELYHSYYALILYSITKLYHSIANFCRNIELSGQMDLCEYFYEGFYIKPLSEKYFQKLEKRVDNLDVTFTEQEKNYLVMRAKCVYYKENVGEWINYILYDLTNVNVRYNGDIFKIKVYTLPVRRIWLFLFTFVGLYYSLIYKNVHVELFNYILNNIFILIFAIILLFICWYKTGYTKLFMEYKEIPTPLIKYERYGHGVYHILFYVISLCSIIFALIIFLHSNFLLLMSDTFIECIYLKITIPYSIQEKIQYIHFTINELYPLIVPLITEIKEIDPKIMDRLSITTLHEYIHRIDYTLLITNNTTLTELQDYCSNLIKLYIQKEREYITFLIELHVQDIYANGGIRKLFYFFSVLVGIVSIKNTYDYFITCINVWHMIHDLKGPETIEFIQKFMKFLTKTMFKK